MISPPFRVETEAHDGVCAVTVSGELDQATAEELRRPLLDVIGSGEASVLIDLTDCAFIDSTGLSVLVQAHRELTEDGTTDRRFTVCCPDPQVRRLLEITGLDTAMHVFQGRDEALAALTG